MARTLEQHLFEPGKKRVLAVDGGGARGVLALGVLKRIETILADRLPFAQRAHFRLHHYFDLIGGTSTGSILAAGLAIGLSVEDLKKLYFSLCPKIFAPTRVKGVRKPRFDARVLASELDRVLREADGRALPLPLGQQPAQGQLITLGSPALHTGFAAFAKRINTGGAWTLTNNPNWTYYDEAAAARHGKNFSFQPNAAFPLARIVQASAAAPTYFDTVGLDVEAARAEGSTGVNVQDVDGVFVDGALSGRNTPALQMLLMIKHKAFGFEWKTTEDDLLMVSVGTGWWRPRVTEPILNLKAFANQAREAFRAIETLQTMIHDSSLHALTMMQGFSRYPDNPEKRWVIDGEIEAMDGFLMTPEPLLRFRRMDVRLDGKNLEALLGRPLAAEAAAVVNLQPTPQHREAGVAWGEDPLVMRLRELAEFDVEALRLQYHIGETYARRFVDDDDFPTSFDPAAMGAPGGEDTVGVIEEEERRRGGLLSRLGRR